MNIINISLASIKRPSSNQVKKAKKTLRKLHKAKEQQSVDKQKRLKARVKKLQISLDTTKDKMKKVVNTYTIRINKLQNSLDEATTKLRGTNDN